MSWGVEAHAEQQKEEEIQNLSDLDPFSREVEVGCLEARGQQDKDHCPL